MPTIGSVMRAACAALKCVFPAKTSAIFGKGGGARAAVLEQLGEQLSDRTNRRSREMVKRRTTRLRLKFDVLDARTHAARRKRKKEKTVKRV
jgi:hypothetical protein